MISSNENPIKKLNQLSDKLSNTIIDVNWISLIILLKNVLNVLSLPYIIYSLPGSLSIERELHICNSCLWNVHKHLHSSRLELLVCLK